MSQYEILEIYNASGFAIGAALVLVGWTGACGKTSQGANNPSDGPSVGSGGTQSDVAPVTGGATGAGGLGHDAGPGSGGATGSGGVTNDGGAQVAWVSLPDAGQDGASSADAPADVGSDGGSVDAAGDAGGQSCGNSTCHSGQACVLILPGVIPQCLPLPDGGSCPAGLVQTAYCGGGYLPPSSPGCTQPAPTPACVDVPNGCSDPCDCICHVGGGAGCYAGAGYWTCAMP